MNIEMCLHIERESVLRKKVTLLKNAAWSLALVSSDPTS